MKSPVPEDRNGAFERRRRIYWTLIEMMSSLSS